MLNKRLRKQIEWHFYNYKSDASLYVEREKCIINAGLTTNYNNVRGHSYIGSPTESKALKLVEDSNEENWPTVVRNTFIAFKFKDSYPIMKALYIDRRNIKDILCDGIWETTFYRWRDEWLEYALRWAEEFGII